MDNINNFRNVFVVVFLAVLIVFTACASEQKLQDRLSIDPGDIQALSSLAEMKYDKGEYEEAYGYYERLRKLVSLQPEQEYYFAISSTRKPEPEMNAWTKIDGFRNTEVVDFKRENHNSLLSVNIPEHWVIIAPNNLPSMTLVKALNLPLEDRAVKFTRDNNATIPEIIKDEGILYAGKGFIIEYDIIHPVNYNDVNATFVYKVFELEKELVRGVKSLRNRKAFKNITEIKAYVMEREFIQGAMGRKIILTKTEYDATTKLNDPFPLFGYITYVEVPGKTTEEELFELSKIQDPKVKQIMRKVAMVIIGNDGVGRMVLRTEFEETKSDLYLTELETFIEKNKMLPLMIASSK